MKLYHLTGAQFALSNLALCRIKISRFSDLNDPFELMAVNLSDDDERRAVAGAVILFVKGEQVEAVPGKQREARRQFADAIDVEKEREDAIDETVSARAAARMHDAAEIKAAVLRLSGHQATAGTGKLTAPGASAGDGAAARQGVGTPSAAATAKPETRPSSWKPKPK